ncbi:hypothetical protein [Chitinophaga sp. sic0106]|uniref:hypothetical protein n=1 Tax=Chitinophaga sp. sic0106 TaxID=2854785 RepID=UPI001C43C586|nr:hypothetical protein [Chitinophaga sp. sic0106]MBV7532471.1 hypothetical protein [Chitinophaga sp. sic0106]
MQNTDKSLKRKVNFLMYYAVISTSIFLVFILSSFVGRDKNLTADELTVKRITVVGEDNIPRMVLSNETRQHSGRMEGKDIPKRDRPAGIIFFTNRGDECGGIVAATTTKDGSVNHGMSFTMDNYHDDQVIQLLNDETYENGKAEVSRGLMFNEYPVGSNLMDRMAKTKELEKIADPKERDAKIGELWNKEGAKRRMFIGRNVNADAGVFLYDAKGKPKMKIYVDKAGNPKIEVRDSSGQYKNIIPQ